MWGVLVASCGIFILIMALLYHRNTTTAKKLDFKNSHLTSVGATWWDAGGIFVCLDTDPFSARCQSREGHSPLAIHTAVFVRVLVLLAAGFALCFGVEY